MGGVKESGGGMGGVKEWWRGGCVKKSGGWCKGVVEGWVCKEEWWVV